MNNIVETITSGIIYMMPYVVNKTSFLNPR